MAFAFGNFMSFAPTQAFNELLEQEDTTLEQVLDQDSAVSQMIAGNERLISFFTKERVQQLLVYITEVAEDETNVQRARKFPFVADELLNVDLSFMKDMVLQDDELLKQLLGFYDQREINILLAGYVSKYTQTLMSRDLEGMLTVIFEKSNVASRIVSHINNQSTSELISKIITAENNTTPNLFLKQRLSLIDQIVEKLCTSNDDFMILYSSKVICDLINVTEKAVNSWEICMARLCSPNNVNSMFANLNSESPQKIRATVNVLHQILTNSRWQEIITNSEAELMAEQAGDPEQDDEVLIGSDDEDEQPFMDRMIEFLESSLVNLLEANPDDEMETSFGQNIKRFGESRLKLAELVLDILKTSNGLFNRAIIASGVLTTLTNQFFEYHWNSCLHFVYTEIAQAALTSSNELAQTLIKVAKLPEKLVVSVQDWHVSHGNGIQLRKGNYGHITKLANTLVRIEAEDTELARVLESSAAGWAEYTSGELQIQNELENRNIGGSRPGGWSDSPEPDLDKFDFFNPNLPEDDEDEEDTPGQGSWEENILKQNFAYPSYAVKENQDPGVRPGTPATVDNDLYKANLASTGEYSEELAEYNSNVFWSTSYDVDLEDLE